MTKLRYRSLPLLIALAVGALAPLLVHCSDDGGDPPPPPVYPPACTNTAVCRQTSVYPRCADIVTPSPKCISGECVYRLKIATVGCVCIVGEVRKCIDDDGNDGIKRCEEAGDAGSQWSSYCDALNTP